MINYCIRLIELFNYMYAYFAGAYFSHFYIMELDLVVRFDFYAHLVRFGTKSPRTLNRQEAQLLLGWPTVLPYSRRLCKSCGAFMQIGPAVFS